MSKPLVLFTAPVGTRSGYGAHSRDIARSLIAMDRFDIKIFPVRWGSTPQNALNEKDPNDIEIIKRLLNNPNMERQPDIHIHCVIPNEFMTIGKYNIGITAGIESTACPQEWLDGMNRMDLNIVPSNFTKEVFENCVYDRVDNTTKKVLGSIKNEKPIEVLFEGADTTIYKKPKQISKELKKEFKNIPESFLFLYVGHWLSGSIGNDRKDTGMLVKVFLETFKNHKKKPALLMKTNSADFSILDREEMVKRIRDIKNTIKGDDLPNIYLLHGDLTDEEMNELYHHPRVKAHTSLTHGEGFGRPLLEASLSEKPVIASNWSGHRDFLPEDKAIMLPGSLTKVPSEAFPENIYVEGSQWFSVNYPVASNTMKDVYDNYKKYVPIAKKLSFQNRNKFSLDAMTKKFEKILDKYLPEFQEQVSLKLPKLKSANPKSTSNIKLPTLKKK
jgi:glycosyltransferase involved in cell wall biosynthesis